MLARAFANFKAESAPPDADHRRLPDRLRGAHQGGHPRRARRAAGRGGDPRRQAVLRLARGRRLPGPRRGLRALPCRDRRPRPRAARGLGRAVRGVPRAVPGPGRPPGPDAAAHPARRTGTPTSRCSRPTPRAWPAARPTALVLNAIGAKVPWLVGGSADLAPSTKTLMTFEGAGDFSVADRAGRNLHFGVREHAAGCIANGLALSKVRPYQAGFLIFSDFQRGAIRLSALMEIPVIHVYTHDSIGVGEDGPDPPAGGADRVPARSPGPGRHPPGGRQRGRRGLARAHADAARPGGAVPVPPGPANPGPHPLRPGVRAGPGGLRPGRSAGRARPGGHPDRLRIRGRAGGGGLRGTDRRGRGRPRREPALLGAVRPPGRGLPRSPCSPRPSRPG